jgi:hypothetical protein
MIYPNNVRRLAAPPSVNFCGLHPHKNNRTAQIYSLVLHLHNTEETLSGELTIALMQA